MFMNAKAAALRLSVKPQTLCRRAALEPEPPAPGAYQHSQRAAVVVRGGLHSRAQAGDAVIELAEFDQAIAEIHAGAVMRGVVRQHAPEALGRAGEVAFVLQRHSEADQGIVVSRHNRERTRERDLGTA